MSDPKNVKVRITAADETRGPFASAKAEVKGFSASVNGAFDTIREHWALLTSVLAGGALFKEVITSTMEWTNSVVQLSKRLGITTEDASGLNVALHHVGLGVDDYATVAQKMTKQLRTNEDAFKSLGIATHDSNGEWRSTTAVLGDAVDKLNGMKAGTDRNIATQELFGARVGNVTAILRLNTAMLEESAEKARKYHLVIGPDGAALVRHYKDAMADLKLVSESLSVQMGEKLLPVLLKASEAMGEKGPKAADAFGRGIIFVTKAALEGYAAVNALVQLVKFIAIALSTPVGPGQFKSFAATVKQAYFDMGDSVTKVNDDVLNSLVRLQLHGKPALSASPTGDTLGGGDGKESEYLKTLEKEVGLLTKGAELGTLRLENVRQLIRLQEHLLQQANDPRASLADRNAAQAGANALEKANPFAGIPGLSQTRNGPAPGGKAPPMANVTGVAAPGAPPGLGVDVHLADMLVSGFRRADDAIQATRASMAELTQDIGSTARNAVDGFALAWGDAAQQIASGAESVGQAVLKSTRKAIGGAVAAKGQETLLDAAKAFAQGFHDPSMFLVAAKLFAVGTGYEALAGVLGGSGAGGGGYGGGGGGGLSPGGFGAGSQASTQGKITVVWPMSKKAILDPTDPDDQDAIIAMLNKIAGNRQIDFQFTG